MNDRLLALIVSLLFFLAWIVCLFRSVRKNQLGQKHVMLLLLLFLAISPLSLYPSRGDSSAPFSVLPKTIQAFSVDTDYEDVFGQEPPLDNDGVDRFFNIYKAILYSLAPLLGGTVIYDVFVGISPNVKLRFVRNRRLYVFSELNARSLCLARSIVEGKTRGRRPVLIFADCKAGSGENGFGALSVEAQRLHAICLPEALNQYTRLRYARECVFFLMNLKDGHGYDDLKTLGIIDGMLGAQIPIWPRSRGCHLFCFTDRAERVESIRAAKLAYDQSHGEAGKRVVIHVIRDYAQASSELLTTHPLFSALEGAPAHAPLRVLIIGNNDFSREMFKTVFWCGQLLDHPLQIGVACEAETRSEGKTAFERWLDTACPELLESCSEGSDCLRATLAGDHNAAYASLGFAELPPEALYGNAFPDNEIRFRYGSSEAVAFGQFDYIIAMTDSDEANVRLAESLWRQFVRARLEDGAFRRKTVAVAIQDDTLCRITRRRYAQFRERADVGDFIIFGDLESRFCWGNVFKAGIYDHHPEAMQSAMAAMHSLAGMDVTRDDIYNEWSSTAREVHLKYKMYSALRRAPAKPEDAMAVLEEKCDYCRALRCDPALFERLNWLEHRRWNAFLRAQGFTQPPRLAEKLRDFAEGRCAGETVEALSPYAYKNVPALMHPDLVESLGGRRTTPPDLLDLASDLRKLVDRKMGKAAGGTIKDYDDPDGINGPTLSRAEVCACLMGTDPALPDSAVDEAWEKLEAQYPDIGDCSYGRCPGRYCADRVLDRRGLTGTPVQGETGQTIKPPV